MTYEIIAKGKHFPLILLIGDAPQMKNYVFTCPNILHIWGKASKTLVSKIKKVSSELCIELFITDEEEHSASYYAINYGVITEEKHTDYIQIQREFSVYPTMKDFNEAHNSQLVENSFDAKGVYHYYGEIF